MKINFIHADMFYNIFSFSGVKPKARCMNFEKSVKFVA